MKPSSQTRYERTDALPLPPAGGRRRNLMLRLGSSVILISFVLGTLFWLPVACFAVVVSGFMLSGLYEFFTMVRKRGIIVNRFLGMGLGVLFTLLVAWRSLVETGLMAVPVGQFGTDIIRWTWDIFWPLAIISMCVRQIARGNTFEALSGMGTTLFGLAYIPALFGYIFYIRSVDPSQGAELVLYLLLVTKMGDAGAYIVGNLLGRHALVPRISPRKTVEGFFGAILFSAAVAVVAQPLLGRPLPPIPSFALGGFLGLFGQLGDLSESLIKRDCQIKDTSRLLPGLGGILDVIDSLLFTAPLFYAFLIYG